jgi:hypothetical protein
MESEDRVAIVGLREGLLDHPARAEMDHEVLVLIGFNDVLDNGLPSSEEDLQSARDLEGWIGDCLRARCPTEKAVHVTGDGAREAWFYTADPVAAIEVWEKQLQPNISSHQVAFYVRHDPEWQVYNHFATAGQREGQSSQAGPVVHQFLTESLAGCREMLEKTPSLWLPVHLFAYGAAQALGEEEGLQPRQIISLAYTLFIRALGIPAEESAEAARWIMEHEEEPPVQAVINEGAEAVKAWQAGEQDASRLGELLAEIGQTPPTGEENG